MAIFPNERRMSRSSSLPLNCLATIIRSLRDKSLPYPTSQQAGIGLRSSSSNTTIKTNARQRIKAHQRPEPNFGTALLGSHGNMFVTYRPTSIPGVSICSAPEDPNAASQAAHTGDSVLFSSPQTGHWPALDSGFTNRNINPILGPQQLN
jgi:hypothetical protein